MEFRQIFQKVGISTLYRFRLRNLKTEKSDNHTRGIKLGPAQRKGGEGGRKRETRPVCQSEAANRIKVKQNKQGRSRACSKGRVAKEGIGLKKEGLPKAPSIPIRVLLYRLRNSSACITDCV